MARVINVTGKTQGRLIITPPDENGVMLVQREYTLIGDDDLLNEIPLRVLNRTPLFADLPQSFKDALVAMNAWTSTEIDEDEEL